MLSRLTARVRLPWHAKAGPTVYLLDNDERQLAESELAQWDEAREATLDEMPHPVDVPLRGREKPPLQATVRIDPSKIGLLLGQDAATIRNLAAEFESQIEVDDSGLVSIYSGSGTLAEKLSERISSITTEVKVGDAFSGKVVKTTTFGAFVELVKGTDGLLHISDVAPGRRVGSVEEVLHEGDIIDVRVIEVDQKRGRIGLRLDRDPGTPQPGLATGMSMDTAGPANRPPGPGRRPKAPPVPPLPPRRRGRRKPKNTG